MLKLSLVLFFFIGIGAQAQSPPEGSPQPAEARPALPTLKKIRRTWDPNVWSHGYIMGRLVNSTNEGFVWKRYSGEVLLGVDSVPGGTVDDLCLEKKLRDYRRQYPQYSQDEIRAQAYGDCTDHVNPFDLSSYNTRWPEKMASVNLQDQVLIHFEAHFIHPFLSSPYVIKEAIPVRDYKLPVSALDETDRFPILSRMHYGRSYYEGRAVIASQEGVIRRHYHLVMQIGTAGSKFMHIEVPTRTMFDFIVDTMAAGRMIRVYYFDLYRVQAWPGNLLKGYTTRLRAYRTEVIN